MVRLDRWLVDHGYFPSRQAAKRAIESGNVVLNGRIPKPASKVQPLDSIEVSSDYLIRPFGYYKLHEINSQMGGNLISQGFKILDIGSSAGGFLMYALDQGATVIGVEVSPEFVDKLNHQIGSYTNASLINANAFTINPLNLANPQSIDVLLIDVTTDWLGSLTLLQRFLRVLKNRGLFVLAIKIRPNDPIVHQIVQRVVDLGVEAIPIVLSSKRQEIHIVGRLISDH